MKERRENEVMKERGETLVRREIEDRKKRDSRMSTVINRFNCNLF